MLTRAKTQLPVAQGRFLERLRRGLALRVLQGSARSATRHGQPLLTRKRIAALSRLAPPTRGITSKYGKLGGVHVRWLTPKSGVESSLTVFYIHGGGFALCDLRSHQQLASNLVKTSRARCVLVAYRRAPNNPFPTPLNDCLRAYDALVASGVDPERIVVAGDSAGGNLTVALVQALRQRGSVLPRAVCLISPWVDLTFAGSSIHTNRRTDYLRPELLRMFADGYLQGHDPTDPMVSPVFADFRGFPPMLVQVGSDELLLSEVRTLAQRARAGGVHVELQEWEGMFHAWHGFGVMMPEAKSAFSAIARFIRSQERGPRRVHARTLEAQLVS